MKELNSHIKESVQESIQQAPIETEYFLMGRIKTKAGQKVFEIELSTGNISEASYKVINVDYLKALKKDYSPEKELIVKSGHIYIPALNKQTALKKFRKSKNQSDYFQKDAPMNLDEIIPRNLTRNLNL